MFLNSKLFIAVFITQLTVPNIVRGDAPQKPLTLQELHRRVSSRGTRATNSEGDDYVPSDNSEVLSDEPGHFAETINQSGSAAPAQVSATATQDTTVEATATNLTAFGTLEVKASGTGVNGPQGGWAGADPTASLELVFAITQPMGAILEVNTSNSASDARDIPEAELYQNIARLLGTGFVAPFEAGDLVLQGNTVHKPDSVKTAFRLGLSPDSGTGIFHFTIDQEEYRILGINAPEGTFSYDRKATFTLTVQPLAPLPEFTSFNVTAPNPARASSSWTFTATLPSDLLGLQVLVESSPTGEDGTWTLLPEGVMTLDSGAYKLISRNIPKGKRFFRAVASSPLAAGEMISKQAGPYEVLPGFEPPVGTLTVLPSEVMALQGLWPKGTYGFYVTGPDSTGPNAAPGLRMHIQYQRRTSTNTTAWTEFNGGSLHQISGPGSVWELESNVIPVLDNIYYRVVASAPDYEDSYSNEAGPFDFREILYTTEEFSSDTSLKLAAPNGGDYLIRSKDCTTVMVTNAELPPLPPGALGFTATACGHVNLSVLPGTTASARTVVVGENATVVDEGEIKADVDLAKSEVISHDGGGARSTDGAGVVSNDESTLVSHDGGSLISQDGTSLLSPGGSNLLNGGELARNAATANLVATGGGNLVATGGGNRAGGGPQSLQQPSNPRGKSAAGPGAAPSAATGVMKIDGNFRQFAGILAIGIGGANTNDQGALQYDQLQVTGTAQLLGGAIGIAYLDPNNQTNVAGAYQPKLGDIYDLVVAKRILLQPEFGVFGRVAGEGQFFRWSVVDRADGNQALRFTVTNVPPLLQIRSDLDHLTLSYATNYTGYAIQNSATLGSASWTTMSSTTNVVAIERTNSTAFFRLIKQ